MQLPDMIMAFYSVLVWFKVRIHHRNDPSKQYPERGKTVPLMLRFTKNIHVAGNIVAVIFLLCYVGVWRLYK